VLNAANEVAVEAFLDGKISFVEIPQIIESVMNTHQLASSLTIETILKADQWARKEAERLAAFNSIQDQRITPC
jgi:1-deoxy-D-xylulose-5-phosphate reductoisomerase